MRSAERGGTAPTLNTRTTDLQPGAMPRSHTAHLSSCRRLFWMATARLSSWFSRSASPSCPRSRCSPSGAAPCTGKQTQGTGGGAAADEWQGVRMPDASMPPSHSRTPTRRLVPLQRTHAHLPMLQRRLLECLQHPRGAGPGVAHVCGRSHL